MKTIYIPKGETVSYESLVVDKLIVEGCLKVAYGIKAKIINGGGVICDGTVAAGSVCISELEAASVVCDRLIAKRVHTPELLASESAAVSCFLSAAYVETGRLTVMISEIDEVKAEEVINLPFKKRSLFGTLLASALRAFWIAMTTTRTLSSETVAGYASGEPQATSGEVEDPVAEQFDTEEIQSDAQEEKKSDEELNRIINLFQLTRDAGYTLRIVPGTPEENAPVFDFANERIIRPAA